MRHTKVTLHFATLLILTAATLTTPPASAKSVGECLDQRSSGDYGLVVSTMGLVAQNRNRGRYGELGNVPSQCVAGNYIQLDCNGKGMDNESTIDTITATVFDADGTELFTKASTVGCDSITDHTFHFVPWLPKKPRHLTRADYDDAWILETKTDPRAQGMYVVLSTNGKDAFWIDEMYLGMTKAGKDPVIAHWGAENGKGFCLSTDPSDGTGSWKSKVEGCHKAIKFVVGDGSCKASTHRHTKDHTGCAEDEATKVHALKAFKNAQDEAFEITGFRLENPYGLKGYTAGSGTAWEIASSMGKCAAKAAEEGQKYFTWYSKGEFSAGARCKTWNDPAIRWQQSTRDVEMRHYAATNKAHEEFKNAQ